MSRFLVLEILRERLYGAQISMFTVGAVLGVRKQAQLEPHHHEAKWCHCTGNREPSWRVRLRQ